MARHTKGQGSGSGSVLLAIVAIVAFVWGLERWRRGAAHRAGRSERARLMALARCLLGPDGTELIRSPDETRRRLRTLAMATPTEASVTWFDRCIPLAQALARHASEVDDTGAPTAAQTRVSEAARALQQSMTRVGLVWRIRVGDPETDMDPVADQLARVASEISLAGAPQVSPSDIDGPIAPSPPEMPTGSRMETTGLEPTPIGGPDLFYVGAPLPALAEVVHDREGWHLGAVANEPSHAFRVGSVAVTRIDVRTDANHDGLAPLRLFRPGVEPIEVRVTPVDDPLEGLHVALDATVVGRALWLAQWTPWRGTVLARFVPGRATTALALASAPAGTSTGSSTWSRRTDLDEHVAVAPLGAGAVVAYTVRDGDRSSVVLASTLANSDRAPVSTITTSTVRGRPPGLEFCTLEGASPVLLVAGTYEWFALRISSKGVTEIARVIARRGRTFDHRLVVRCTRDGIVAYAREHPRTSPVIVCPSRAERPDTCETVEVPVPPMLSTMPSYVTRTPSGRLRIHADWPLALALAGETLVAARAVGPVVSIARHVLGTDRWDSPRVVFDAAARMHGYTVEAMNVYADGPRMTLAVSAPDGLHLLTSEDAGASWK